MDEQIELYINTLVDNCMQGPAFSGFGEDQKNEIRTKLTEYFNNIIVQTLLENLNEQQLQQLENMDFSTSEAAEKIALFASQTPNLLIIVDQKLQKEVMTIKQTGQIPQ